MRAPRAAELAARLVSDRASRSEHRAPIDAAAEGAAVDVPVLETTTTEAPVTQTTLTTMAAQVAAAATKRVTTTTTTAKPKPKPTTTTTTAKPAPAHSQTGQASWYDTTPGTCAHRTAPMGTILTVTDLADGKQIRCRVADRGPFQAGRIVDLSKSDFNALEPTSTGVIDVRVEW
ncbi:MAG TPA: septal ring lytic transglycosylase RlpA family protein [Acidimicrobiales bacterium]|nr:septal ring lytic transglycosylase RlpA family protein [Acidimicrobiales bacterium]